jgi:hypothetical protein
MKRPSHRARALLLAITVGPAAALVGGAATAAPAEERYGVVTVDLRPEVAEVPTHVCVASAAAGPRTRARLSDILSEESGDQGAEGRRWRLRASAWGGVEGAREARCGGDCGPQVAPPSRIAPPSELFVACAADSLIAEDTARRDPRVLVMMLEHLDASPPVIESLVLAGGVATIGVQANLRRVIVTARSLGGHYAAQQRSARAETSGESKVIVLPLAPRCQWRELELPGARLRERDRPRLSLRIGGERIDGERCLGELRGDGRLRVLTPRVEPGVRGDLELEIAAGAGEGGEGGEPGHFGGRWSGPWPPSPLPLQPYQLAFTWRPPECVYPADLCPRAELESGIVCAAQRDGDLCRYRCPGEVERADPVALTPPLTVHFEKDDPRQRWSDILSRPGQTLSSYATGDQVVVHADVDAWKKDTPGSRITHVEVLGADGSVRRFPLAGVSRLRIPLPAPTCEPLRYRLIGDRIYQETFAELRGGEALLGPPQRQARIMTFNLLLAQGGSLALIRGGPAEIASPSYFVFLGQLAARFRPRHPRFARLAGELRLGGTIGQWGFYSAATLSDDPRRPDDKPLWVRFLFEPAIVVDLIHPVTLTGGVAIGGSWPLRADDVATAGRFAPVVSPSVDVRLAIRPWLALVLQGRAIFGERTFTTVLVGDMQATRRELPTPSLAGLYGLLVSF